MAVPLGVLQVVRKNKPSDYALTGLAFILHSMPSFFLGTLLGISLPGIVSGAVIVEDLFNYPGMGLLTVQAATNADIPTVLGTTLVITVATVAGSLVADILYVIVDPRIRYGGTF